VVHTQCKLLLLDAERADRLEPDILNVCNNAGTVGVLVLNSHEGKGNWDGMECYNSIMNRRNDLQVEWNRGVLQDRTGDFPPLL
jgi:hypothetical protein